MKRLDLVAGTVMLGAGLFFVWGATRLPMGGLHAPESGFVPLLEGIFLSAASLVLIGSSFRGGPGKPVQWPAGDARRMAIQLWAALMGYVLLVGTLGYVLSTFLFVLASTSAWRRYSWRTLGITAAALSLSFYLLFQVALGMSLPQSPLGLP